MSDPFFAANELECYTPSNANVVETTVVGTFDTACTRCSIRVGLGFPLTDYADSPAYTAATTSWTHWESQFNLFTGSSGTTFVTWFDSVDTAVFRLQFTASNVLQAQYWGGTSWTNVGGTTSFTTTIRYVFDLKIICGTSGSFELYVGSSLALSGSGIMTTVPNIARHRLHCITTSSITGGQLHYSQIICVDVSTLNWKYYTKPPTGDGANTAFAGGFGDVDEITLSDADYIESTAANDVETFIGVAMTIPAGTVKAVVVSARALNIATGPQNMQLALRRGTTNYFTANVSGIGLGFKPFLGIWGTDPSTAAAWTRANAVLAANEFGVKSIT